ncbi:hypothetical protein [Mumia sp. DW29H23]|uniref:hypothetical protein n=1 Tax=Mumia sp. DW29H23 TaxID=3421241 RepID=UPI003D692403
MAAMKPGRYARLTRAVTDAVPMLAPRERQLLQALISEHRQQEIALGRVRTLAESYRQRAVDLRAISTTDPGVCLRASQLENVTSDLTHALTGAAR